MSFSIYMSGLYGILVLAVLTWLVSVIKRDVSIVRCSPRPQGVPPKSFRNHRKIPGIVRTGNAVIVTNALDW